MEALRYARCAKTAKGRVHVFVTATNNDDGDGVNHSNAAVEGCSDDNNDASDEGCNGVGHDDYDGGKNEYIDDDNDDDDDGGDDDDDDGDCDDHNGFLQRGSWAYHKSRFAAPWYEKASGASCR